jgi:hypothetical protein
MRRRPTVRERFTSLPRGRVQWAKASQAWFTLRKAGFYEPGQARPWLTFPAIRFLESLEGKDLRVLEFGSGASSVWLTQRFAQVRSIEHDPQWAARVRAQGADVVLADPGGSLWHGPPDSEYLQAGRVGAPFDVVFVDGMARLTCVEHIDEFVRPDGLVVVDDTDVEQMSQVRQQLAAAGFAAIDFWGMRPGLGLESATTVFCRDFSGFLRG